MAGENAGIVLATVEDGKEFGKYVKSEQQKELGSFMDGVKDALNTWLADKDDDKFTEATGIEGSILPQVAERSGDPFENLQQTKLFKTKAGSISKKIAATLGKANAENYLDRVKKGREEGHPRPELQFADLERRSDFDIDDFRAKIEASYNKQSSSYYSAARLWDDGIIDPLKTREVLGLSFYVCARNIGEQERYGVFRM